MIFLIGWVVVLCLCSISTSTMIGVYVTVVGSINSRLDRLDGGGGCGGCGVDGGCGGGSNLRYSSDPTLSDQEKVQRLAEFLVTLMNE